MNARARSAAPGPAISLATALAIALAIALVAACGGPGVAPTAGPAKSPPPAVGASPRATTSPCAIAVTHLGTFTRRMGDRLASLRPLVEAKRFDAAETAAAIRRVSATLTDFSSLEGTLLACEQAVGLAEQVALLRDAAEQVLVPALALRVSDTGGQKSAGAGLLALLPDVLALAEAAKETARALGVDVAVATATGDPTKPAGSPAPPATPTPRPAPTPRSPAVAKIKASFFGSNVKVTTYRVSGRTPDEILRSIRKKGPASTWLGERAAGQTRTRITYRFAFSTDWSGACRIVAQASPAIALSTTIVLPRWTPRSGTSPATVQWWNETLRSIARHEKVHVSIYRAATKRARSVLATSTCANATRRLNRVWSGANRDNCEFDMKEYGTAAGLSMKSCLAH
jgi:predicted secreted Zn-dependent protease